MTRKNPLSQIFIKIGHSLGWQKIHIEDTHYWPQYLQKRTSQTDWRTPNIRFHPPFFKLHLGVTISSIYLFKAVISSSIGRGHFHMLAIGNNAAMKMKMHMRLQDTDSFPLDIPRGRICCIG